MDRITSALLKEFSNEHDLTKLPEDKQFEHFSAYLTVHRHYGQHFDTSEIVTGAGNDLGIDAIAIVVNGSLVTDPDEVIDLLQQNGYLDVIFLFVQAKRSGSFESSKIGQFAFGVVDFFKEPPSLPQNEFIKGASQIMTTIFSNSAKFKRGNPVCRLYYITTGMWTNDRQLETRREAAISDLQSLNLFRDVEFVPVDASTIQRLYTQSKNSISKEFSFMERSVVPEIAGVKEAYLGLIPASELVRIIAENDEIVKTLFYDNVRGFQDYNKVNAEMRETLKSPDKSRFALMNNGVTIIARTLRATGNKFLMEDFQVVNGCQTCHVLYENKELLDSTVLVPLRLIATNDESITASIIKATNRQTEVKQEQLLALSEFGKRLELYLKAFPPERQLFYERRSRQYNSMSNIEKTRIVNPSNLIRSYASVFLEEPHRVTKSYTALLGEIGKAIFAEDHRFEPYYISALLIYRLEYLFRNQSLDAKYKVARFHILLAARLLGSEPKLLPPANSNEMRRLCEKFMDVLWDVNEADALFKKASDAVSRVANGNFNREHIRTLPFTDALKAECGNKQASSKR